jgi:hypothetical protein
MRLSFPACRPPLESKAWGEAEAELRRGKLSLENLSVGYLPKEWPDLR